MDLIIFLQLHLSRDGGGGVFKGGGGYELGKSYNMHDNDKLNK